MSIWFLFHIVYNLQYIIYYLSILNVYLWISINWNKNVANSFLKQCGTSLESEEVSSCSEDLCKIKISFVMDCLRSYFPFCKTVAELQWSFIDLSSPISRNRRGSEDISLNRHKCHNLSCRHLKHCAITSMSYCAYAVCALVFSWDNSTNICKLHRTDWYRDVNCYQKKTHYTE